MTNQIDFTSNQEWELIVRDLTDQGMTRKEAEKIATGWMIELVK